jgi:hypothetical protein
VTGDLRAESAGLLTARAIAPRPRHARLAVPTWLGLAELALPRLALPRLGLAELALTELALTELRLAELVLAKLGLAELGLAELVLALLTAIGAVLAEPVLADAVRCVRPWMPHRAWLVTAVGGANTLVKGSSLLVVLRRRGLSVGLLALLLPALGLLGLLLVARLWLAQLLLALGH